MTEINFNDVLRSIEWTQSYLRSIRVNDPNYSQYKENIANFTRYYWSHDIPEICKNISDSLKLEEEKKLLLQLHNLTKEHAPVRFELTEFVYHLVLTSALGKQKNAAPQTNPYIRAVIALLGNTDPQNDPSYFDSCVLVRTAAQLNPRSVERHERPQDIDPFTAVEMAKSERSQAEPKYLLPAYACNCMSGSDSLKAAFNYYELMFLSPGEFDSRLKMTSRFSWSTQATPTEWDDYFLSSQLVNYLSGPIENQYAVGHAGHGMNSYALTTRFVSGPLVIVVQEGWGGAYGNLENDTARWIMALEEIAPLLEILRSPHASHLTQPDGVPIQRTLQLILSPMRNMFLAREYIDGTWQPLGEFEDILDTTAAVEKRLQELCAAPAQILKPPFSPATAAVPAETNSETTVTSADSSEDAWSDEVDLSDIGHFYDTEDIYIALEEADLVDIHGQPSPNMSPEALARHKQFLTAQAKKNTTSVISGDAVPCYFVEIDIWPHEDVALSMTEAKNKFGTEESILAIICGPRWSVALRRGARDAQIPLDIVDQLLEAVDGSTLMFAKEIPEAEGLNQVIKSVDEVVVALSMCGFPLNKEVPEEEKGMKYAESYIHHLVTQNKFAEYMLPISFAGLNMNIPVQIWIEPLNRESLERMIDAYFGNDGRDDGLAIGDGWCIRFMEDSAGKYSFAELEPIGELVEKALNDFIASLSQ